MILGEKFEYINVVPNRKIKNFKIYHFQKSISIFFLTILKNYYSQNVCLL